MKKAYLFFSAYLLFFMFLSPQVFSETVGQNPAEKPRISVEHGFFKKPFEVVINTAIDGMTIYYTLDGSDPANSGSAFLGKAPIKVYIDPRNSQGRGKTPGVVLRARSKSDQYAFSPIATETYLFIDNLDIQTSFPGHDWPQYNINGQYIDLAMDSRIITDPVWGKQLLEAFSQIPSISIATDNQNLFAADSGIYVNATGRGLDWERPASVELINPNGSEGFKVDAGLRIRGGYSRNDFFAKHAFRLFFRNEYGTGRLEFPLFGDEGAQNFDKVDLRCAQNYSWSKGGSEAPFYTFTRDVFSRDAQGKMNQEYTRSRYYHLFINGLYWGLYQTQERAESSFAADYMGGNAEDYDIVKRAGEVEAIEATEGTLDAWFEVWTMCQKGFTDNSDYYKLQGMNPDGVRDPSLKVLVDVDNLIDYMNIIFYTGNFDAPVSSFMNNKGPNNFFAIYNRNDDRGFTFIAHDNEHTLLSVPVPGNPNNGINENRVNIGSLRSGNKMEVSSFDKFHPQWLHFRLSQNTEYRQRFADKAYQFFYNQGIFTPEMAAALFKKRTLEIDTAVIAESARWGDIDYGILRTKDDWLHAVDQTMTDFFPYRTDIVIQQLKDEGLLPKNDAPIFKHSEKQVLTEILKLAPGETIEIDNPNSSGNVSYTLDGSDPRLAGGNISQKAANGGSSAAIAVLQSCTVNARVYDNGLWSALHSIHLEVDPKLSGLQVTEIHYNPLGEESIPGSEFEFIELKNNGITQVNLTGATFKEGINFYFAEETVLKPGNFIVLASNAVAFKQRYGFAPSGEYDGQLDNKGEELMLVNAVGDTLIHFSYNDKQPWPASADGLGFSLVPKTKVPGTDWDNGANWRASATLNGSPDADDPESEIHKILINEVLANSEAPQTDAVELFNPNDADINVGGWYLSDKQSSPKKWKISEGTIVPAHGFVVFNEGHYEGDQIQYAATEFGSSFSLSSKGEGIFLFSAAPSGELTGYQTGFDFEASEPGISFGRYVNSTNKEQFVAQAVNTLGETNGLPKVGPVIINQIMYHPDENQFEFIELVNISGEKVDLFDETLQTPWKVSGIDFVFPENTSIEPGQSIYLVEQSVSPADFKTLFSLDESTQIFNYNGKLQNDGETIALLKSYQSEYDNGELKVPYIVIDRVDYNDNELWPAADGNGNALQRISQNVYGDDPAAWKAVAPELRIKNKYLPDAIAGVAYNKELTAVGGTLPYTWTTSGDGLPEGLSLNPTTGLINGNPETSGTFDIKIKVEDALAISKEVVLSLEVHTNTAPVAQNDTVSVAKNHVLNFMPQMNDTDNDGDIRTWGIEIIAQPKHGTVSIDSDKILTYIPEKDNMEIDSLSYRVTDISGSSEAKVIIYKYDDTPMSYTYKYVNRSSDDSEENLVTGKMNLTSTILEMPYDDRTKANQLIGIRFSGIQLPQGAVISQAYLVFNSAKVDSSDATLTIQGEASVNPGTYTSSGLISSRLQTNASVVWKPASWETVDDNYSQRFSANIAPIINEVIGMGWQSGNPMAFIISGEGTASRAARSFDSGQWSAPILYIIYSDPNIEAAKPVAAISTSSTVGKGNQVTLSPQGSNSSDGRLLNYYWTLKSKPEGSTATITNPYLVSPSFIADVYGTYEVTLKVDNGIKESDEVSAVIVAENHAPIANAGTDQIYTVGSTVRLNGSASTDVDGDVLAFNWQWIEKPEGSIALLSSGTDVKPTFVADKEGIYLLSLVVSDYDTSSEPQVVEFTVVSNKAPIADAGYDLEVIAGMIISTDGSNSSDPEGAKLQYNWSVISKPAGSLFSFNGQTNSKPVIQPDVAGEYTIQLIVSDGINSSEPDEMKLTAINNLPPVAVAGDDISTTEHLAVPLDGSQSYDPEKEPLLFQWSFVAKPANSNASLQEANTAKPVLITDIEGTFTLKLKVSDGVFSAEDMIQVTAENATSVQSIKAVPSLSVYPNLFGDYLVVSYSTASQQKIEFRLNSLSGALIKSFQFSSSGKMTQNLNLGDLNLKAGIYLLTMRPENGDTQTIKLIHH